MAGNDAIAAALAAVGPMVGAGFGRPKSRYQDRIDYGNSLMKTGASAAPVSGWVEGIARALQGPLGGYLRSEAADEQQASDAGQRDELTSAFATNDFGKIARALANIPGQEGAAATLLLGRLSQQNQQDQLNDTTEGRAGAPGAGAPPGSAPRGVPAGAGAPPGAGVVGGARVDPARYNVGNIRALQGGFETFDSPEAAVAATIANARAYPAAFNGGRLMPLWDFSIDMAKLKAKDPAELAKAGRTIAGRWAPVGDGANDPAQWARNAANAAGLPPDQSIDLSNPEIAARFARGVHAAEFGGQAAYADLVYTRGAAGQPQPAPAPGVGVPPPQAAPPRPPLPPSGVPLRAAPPGVPPGVGVPPGSTPQPPPAVGLEITGAGAPPGGPDPRPTTPTVPGFTGQPAPRAQADPGAEYVAAFQHFNDLARRGDPDAGKKALEFLGQAYAARERATAKANDRTFNVPPNYIGADGSIQAMPGQFDYMRSAAQATGGVQRPMPGNSQLRVNDNTGAITQLPQPNSLQYDDNGRVIPTPGYAESAAAIAAAQKAPDPDAARHSFTQLPSYKNYTSAAPIYQSMQEAATRNSKAADLNMVYALAKILDPTSVVRESEVVMSRDTGGIADKLNGFISGLRGGATLTPDVRAGMLAEARSRMSGYYNAIQLDAEQYANIAQRRGWNVADTIPAFALLPEPQTDRISQTPRPTAGGPQAAPPANAPAPADPLSQAREAIARGVPLDAVVQRLLERGIDPRGL